MALASGSASAHRGDAAGSVRGCGSPLGTGMVEFFSTMPSRAARAAITTLVVLVSSQAHAQIELARPALTPPPAAADAVPRGQIRFRSFGAPDGIRNQFVVSIVQDGAGFLWIATDDGAYRYDGQQ